MATTTKMKERNVSPVVNLYGTDFQPGDDKLMTVEESIEITLKAIEDIYREHGKL